MPSPAAPTPLSSSSSWPASRKISTNWTSGRARQPPSSNQLVELAPERDVLDELRRLGERGSRDAAAVLAEVTGQDDDGE